MRGFISWNGKRSDQFGIEVSNYPDYRKPQRKMDRYPVPGRNGDIIMMQDAWENVKQTYDIFFGDGISNHSVPDQLSRISEWLIAPKGYCELWDDFDPDHFRLAYFEGPSNLDTLSVGRVGKTTIEFDCQPQRFLFTGKTPIEFSSSPAAIINPTLFASKPMIYVERTADGDGTVTVGGTLFTITGIPASGLYIDCEEMYCYDGNGENMNSHVVSSTSEFATLPPGSSAVSFTGNVQSVTITPRWFEI